MKPILSRRFFLETTLGAALVAVPIVRGEAGELQSAPVLHQPGIDTPQQPFVYFITFDLVAEKKADVAALMKRWTEAADALMAGRPIPGMVDSEDTLGLSQKDLTITFGFGPGVFVKDGKDRYGLASRRPAPLADLPRFTGDQLIAAKTGGDLSVQCCADDPQSAFHAARQIARLAYDIAEPRWAQSGFLPSFGKGKTARNLMGFKDGTINPNMTDSKVKDQYIWAGPHDEAWMAGGSYLVARIIRIALEHWDRMNVPFQEQTMGRQKISGAPMGGKHEFEPLTLKQMDHDGNPITAQNSHARLAAPEENGGAQMLRRAYSYENGLSVIAERWPPWRQANEFDSGLLFLSYQQDPRTGFSKIFERMAKFDMMNQFTTHIGSGLFACPGRRKGHYIGEELLS
ncbi:putative iron-dependent peroxidase [Neokomagataea tanensis NBRC 106556]|uniref:Iron-dependent peroxidase n=1 Tax=Neokomagataea tanensis NBRC 106556 TaxID=1223519 RepID=A0ABQ0QGZ4_9PROT|nr:putative iron-dependent peroxidase [Neokomagataea tanensis NBRC 106556]